MHQKRFKKIMGVKEFTPLIISYLIVGGITIICTGFVVTTLLRFGSKKTHITRLLLLLHGSLLIEEIVFTPYVFAFESVICSIGQWIQYYSSLMNALVMAELVLTYHYLFFEDAQGIDRFIRKHGVLMAIIFPLITILPFSTSAYTGNTYGFCVQVDYTTFTTTLWTLFTFYLWVWIALGVSIYTGLSSIYYLYKTDRGLGNKMLSTVCMYNIASIACWIPRSIVGIVMLTTARSRGLIVLGYMLPVYMMGLSFSIVFLFEKNALALFIKNAECGGMLDATSVRSSILSAADGGSRPSFSWEVLWNDQDSDRSYASEVTTDGSRSHGCTSAAAGQRADLRKSDPSSKEGIASSQVRGKVSPPSTRANQARENRRSLSGDSSGDNSFL